MHGVMFVGHTPIVALVANVKCVNKSMNTTNGVLNVACMKNVVTARKGLLIKK